MTNRFSGSLHSAFIATVLLFSHSSAVIADNITIITAPTSTANFIEYVQANPTSNPAYLAVSVAKDGTGAIYPPTLLPAGYTQGDPIGSSVVIGQQNTVNFQALQNPADNSAALTASYQGSISQSLSFGPSGMNLQLGGSSILGATNTLDLSQPFSAPNTNGSTFSTSDPSQMVINAQLQTNQDIIFSISDTATNLNLHFSNPALSISPGPDLQGNTFAYIQNNFTITPIHTISGFALPSADPNFTLGQFQDTLLASNPSLNLNSYQFNQHAIYGTQLDQNGQTIPVSYTSPSFSMTNGIQTGDHFHYLSSAFGNTPIAQDISASVNLLPGYVYWLHETVQTGVTFGGVVDGVFHSGSGTYLDPSTGLSVSVLQGAAPNGHPVPEPTSFALMGLGGIFLAFGAYRRRREETA